MKPIKYLLLFALLAIIQSCATFHIQKGNEAYNNLKYKDCIRLLEKGLAKKEDYNARKNLADAYYHLSKFPDAAKNYETATLDPKFSDDDRVNYGRSLISTGETEKAAEVFSALISRSSGNESLLSLRQSAFSQDKIKRDSARYNIRPSTVSGLTNVSGPVKFKDGYLVTGQSKKGKKDPYNGLGYNNLFQINREGETWTDPKAIGGLNGPYHDAYAAISPDGQTMVYTRSYSSGNKLEKDDLQTSNTQLYISNLQEDGKWGAGQPAPFCKAQFMYAHPVFSPDGRNLVFSSNLTGTLGGMDLWVTEKLETGWTSPANIGSRVNTEGMDVFPYFKNADTLFFSTNGRLTLGGLDIYQIAQKNGEWGKPKHFGYPFNSNADDFGVAFETPQTGYLSSNRDGNDQLYSFIISGSLMTMEGLVVDKKSMLPISNTKIIILNLTEGTEELDYTDDQGMFSYEFDSGSKYKIIAEKDGYFNLSKEFDSAEMSKEELKAVFELETMLISQVGKDDPSTDGSVNSKSDPDKKGTSNNGQTKEEQGSDPSGDGGPGKDKNGNDISEKKGKDNSGKGTKDKTGKNGSKDKEYPYAIPRILWDYNDANIRPDAIPYLQDLVKLFKDNPNLKVEIRSHCDSRGSHLYNDALSQMRADALVDYLEEKGINISKFTSNGMGKRKPLNGCTDDVVCDDAEHQENRRSEFLIMAN